MLGRKNKKLQNAKPTADVCVSDGVQNAASTLLANIRFSSVDKRIKSVAVTSSVPNEGKTTVAIALAIAMGRSDYNCLVVEGDLRRRSVRGVLRTRSKYGIYSVVSGECKISDAIVPTRYQNVSFLDAELGIPNPESILGSHRFDDLLSVLSQNYDYVVIDTPPVGAFADAAMIASKTDGTIIVAREDYTDRRELEYAAQQLHAADANILGVALNGQKSSSAGYGYYYSYYYDENGNKKKAKSSKQPRANGSSEGKPKE